MSARLIFARRSIEEMSSFGGQVFADIDGKNAAIIEGSTVTVEVETGVHRIKMYKSHNGSMIGFAEDEINLSDGEALVIRYFPPSLITQPGHFNVTEFVSYEKIDAEIESAAAEIRTQKQNAETARKTAEKKSNSVAIWIAVIIIASMIISAASFLIFYNAEMSYISSLF